MKFIVTALVLPFVLFVSSCATILSKSNYPVRVSSEPSGLRYSITNKAGATVSEGKTPATVSLKASSGFFRAASYKVQVFRGKRIVGSTDLTASMDGWYLGNILIGGLVGMLVVDPASGAMWALPKDVHLTAGSIVSVDTNSELKLALIQNISEQDRSKLIPLSK